jgi:hypothetical protein
VDGGRGTGVEAKSWLTEVRLSAKESKVGKSQSGQGGRAVDLHLSSALPAANWASGLILPFDPDHLTFYCHSHAHID